MKENRRVILFALLVTLSPVRGGDFTFYEDAYLATWEFEREHGVSFKKAEQVKFVKSDQPHMWILDPHGYVEGVTRFRKLIPQVGMQTHIQEVQNRGKEFLSYMLMSFHTGFHKIGGKLSKDPPQETLYGKLVICFKARKSELETCFYMLMFSHPVESSDTKYVKRFLKTVHPFSYQQMVAITKKHPIEWKLDSLLEEGQFEYMKKVFLKSTPSEKPSALAKHVKRGESAFYLRAIIVEEALIKDYYAWVSQV